jgi:NADP-dependent 3-hydroxy acid dehydrogenase YdfG
MAEMSPEDWDHVMGINATGAYNAMLCVLPEMRARKDGLVVNISSVAGIRASSLGGIAYSAAKFAQTALGTAVAREVGSEGVRVTNVYPGEVNTPILENRPKPVDDAHKARILQPEDVAHAVMMVATLPPRAHIAELVIKPVWQDHA